jgi:hypothetical protein
MTTEEFQRIEKYRNVKKGQRITFVREGQTYTRKVQCVYVCEFNENVYHFVINRIGSGTGYSNVEPQDVLSVK